MPNWRRIVVGDAFKLSSGDPNYYRDLVLFWPIFLFSIAALAQFTGGNVADRHYAVKLLGCAVVAMLLAKEKLLLLMGIAGFVAFRCLWAFFLMQHDWRLLVTFVLCVCVVAPFRNRRFSYQWPQRILVTDLIVGLSSLGGTIAVIRWMQP
jgi:hypothetical protein